MKRMDLFLALAALMGSAGAASAVITTISDRNSTALTDDSSQAGMFNWSVDGTNQMYQQWFWFRVDGDNAQHSLDTLPVTGRFVTDTNPFVDPAPDTLALQYAGPTFNIQPSWTLRGGAAGSGHADLTETIAINNLGTTALNIHFYQYVDFDLNGQPGGDTVSILNALHNTADQSKAGFSASETVVTPAPSRWETNFYANTLNSLNGGAAYDLNDNAGPTGPGDVTWAFQWDLVINPGGSVVISKDKSIVPSPGSLALLGLGLAAAGRRRR